MNNAGSPVLHQPLRLLRNRIYPSYQLSADAGQKKVPPETVLTIAVLETFSWLRKRFRDFALPSELDWPDPAEYASVDLSSFVSFRIDTGYKVEVIWLSGERVWTLQLTEPDLGPNPGAGQQGREPVPGRLFETNIAFKTLPDRVACGFCTRVSDPEGVTVPCEVFRLALIGQLVRNPLVGLKHGWPLSYEAHRLDRQAALQSLKDWLKDPERMMPAVIVAECASDQPAKASLPPLDVVIGQMSKAPAFPPIELAPPAADQQTPDRLPLDLLNLAHRKMGYAQFFILPLARLAAFRKTADLQMDAGDVLIVEPASFGYEIRHLSGREIKMDPADAENQLDNLVQNYPRGKPMVFRQVAFLPEAKLIERKTVLDLSHSKEEILRAGEEREQALLQRHSDDLRTAEAQCELRDQKIQRLGEKIRQLEQDKAELSEKLDEEKADFLNQLARKDTEIGRMQALLCRPSELDAIPGWINRFFSSRLILHQRAFRELSAVSPDEVNLALLCDALEYLATDYRDELLGLIHVDELLVLCAQKYNRGFDVTPVKGQSVDMYPADYKIKYTIGYKGKAVDSTLDLHLRVGDRNGRLLRIYFLYDKNKKLIVVGSLPRHLRTASYK